MNAGMFYKGVRSLVTVLATATALASAAPAYAMTVGLGDTVKFTNTNAIYRVMGAWVADVKHVTLDLENVNTGCKELITVDRSLTLEDVPGLIVMPQASAGGLPPYL